MNVLVVNAWEDVQVTRESVPLLGPVEPSASH